jgi:hypothetical protein
VVESPAENWSFGNGAIDDVEFSSEVAPVAQPDSITTAEDTR